MKIFIYSCSQKFNKVNYEFEKSDVAFLLSNKYAELFIDISLLHKIPDQTSYYFEHINRLRRNYFYL